MEVTLVLSSPPESIRRDTLLKLYLPLSFNLAKGCGLDGYRSISFLIYIYHRASIKVLVSIGLSPRLF
jgi:hypothetical protein